MKKIFRLAGLLLAGLTVQAQTFTETIKKELTFEKKSDANALMLFNVSGDVKVSGYDGDKIIIEVEKKISGKTTDRLEAGKKEIQLGVLNRADTLLVYTEGICNSFGKMAKNKNRRSKWNGYGYNWDDCNGRDCEKQYDYEMNFSVKVPRNIHVLISTVNNGDVVIENTGKSVVADNVNGSIRLTNIAGATNASTINGNVDLNYVSNPPGDSRYYSLNGDINANFKKGLTADLSFESFNGDLYTNVEQLESMPVSMEKKSMAKGVKYKIGGARYRIGKGGVHLDFETFNGDVYLKEL
jgi:DUF4097 and DUF4098 domain-containing protein YvlB